MIAAKEKLHKLAEEAREADQRNAARAYWEKTQAEERAQEAASLLYDQQQADRLAQKEKIRVEAKAREEERHLRQHNKTVRQVLSQVAKASSHGRDVDDEGDDENSEDKSSSEESVIVNQQDNQQQKRSQQEKGKEPTGEAEKIEGEDTIEAQSQSK